MHIEVLNAAYWLLSLAGELAWANADGVHNPFFQRALVLAYTMSSFVNALATMLTVLFIAFVWCDTRFQREVVDVMEARGHVLFKYKMLATHTNQIPFALLDVFVIKQTKFDLLAKTNPGLLTLLGACAAYNTLYALSLHVNYYKNGGIWVYNFQDDVFKTRRGELRWLVSMTALNMLVIAVYHYFAFSWQAR